MNLSRSMGLLLACFSCFAALRSIAQPVTELRTGATLTSTPIVTRLPGNPIITPLSDSSLGSNINGPSLIRVPDWIQNPLGKYYLYFAAHRGDSIRLAYADRLEGPWTVYKPGTLHLSESHFSDHIASPDVIVDEAGRQIRLYYHGLTPAERVQHTRVAISTDGIHFKANKEPVGKGSAYWRLFRHDGWWYALAMPGKLYRSRDGLTPFESGPQLFPPRQVHNAVLADGDRLHVFFTQAGDSPEHIVYSQVELGPDWNQWKATPPIECLSPQMDWEGANLPITPGRIGALDKPERALRDPAVFREDGKTYLVYAIAGESGIAIAEIKFQAGTSAIRKIDPPEQGFFAKVLDYEGISIKAPDVVDDRALVIARDRLHRMLKSVPEVRAKLKQAGAELHIIGKDQVTSDLPEHRLLKGKPFDGSLTVDQRTRGLGGLLTSCGEENLLELPNDRYRGRDICIHEFAHNIQEHGLSQEARQRIREQFRRSLEKDLWKGAYAATNQGEFFAELTMWYFGTHGDLKMAGVKPADGPEGLKAYDPEAYALLGDIYSGRLQ